MASDNKTTKQIEALNGAKTGDATQGENQPLLHQRSPIIQEFGALRDLPIALGKDARRESVDGLNQILADTITLTQMYKKHHWQVSGHTFYQLHLLLDKHYEEQSELVDKIAERIQMLGGVSTGMPSAVAKLSKIEATPDGVEEVPAQISRLLEAHELILKEARELAGRADDNDDYGSNDLLGSAVIPINEMQVWFISSHLVPEPTVQAHKNGA